MPDAERMYLGSAAADHGTLIRPDRESFNPGALMSNSGPRMCSAAGCDCLGQLMRREPSNTRKDGAFIMHGCPCHSTAVLYLRASNLESTLSPSAS